MNDLFVAEILVKLTNVLASHIILSLLGDEA
mgnify:CR=1 FL=1